MPWPLNNATVAAGYGQTATAQVPNLSSVFVQVNNSAVYWQATTKRDGVLQPARPERFLLPGKGTFEAGTDWPLGEALVLLEFRSGVSPLPATPAQVSVG